MAGENLERARAIYADWDRGDYRSVDWAHADIEYEIVDGPNPGTWAGLDGMAAGWQSFLSAWKGFEAGESEFHELDDGRILVVSTGGGRGKTSGLDVTQMGTKGAALLHFRDGKVARIAVYMDSRRAVADAGLSA